MEDSCLPPGLAVQSPPRYQAALAHRAAESLGLPFSHCRRRACRRRRACHFHGIATGAPACLRNLDAGQRQLFDALYDLAIRIRDHGGHSGLVYAAADPARRALEDAAVALARTIVPEWDRRRFNAFCRARAKLPPAEGSPVAPTAAPAQPPMGAGPKLVAAFERPP